MLLGDSDRLHYRGFRRLLCRDLPRSLLGDFFVYPGSIFRASAVRGLLCARQTSYQEFVIDGLVEHRGPPRASGLIIAKRDATWFVGSSNRRLPLLLSRLVYRYPLPLGFL